VSGRAVVAATSVNHQLWSTAFPPPYNVSIVELEEDPRVRLTTNVVGVEPDEVRVGMVVQVGFEARGDVWIPVFEPADVPDVTVKSDTTLPNYPRFTGHKFEEDVVLSGVGISDVGRRLMRAPASLAVEAATRAMEDAGLTAADIDGISTFPGGLAPLGFAEGGVRPVADALRIMPTWVNGASETNGMTGAIVTAMLAVASGLCRHVLCYRTVAEATATELHRRAQPMSAPKEASLSGGSKKARSVAPGETQWRDPFGALSAPIWYAEFASRYFAEFGDAKEALGRIAVNARTNAAHNPLAVYTKAMSMDDYMAAPMVSTPYSLFDCDAPCDGAVAVIVSARDTVADLRRDPIVVDAVGTSTSERMSWDEGTLFHVPLIQGPAAHLWSRTDLTRDDVDVAQLYDGFSFMTVTWLESLGFCGVGEAADFIGDGSRIALNGDFPLNTGGGQLSGGRLHGFGFVHEAMLQLRGEATGRQIDDAKVAIVATAGGMPGGAMLLRTWDS
jgi:acetyl-CoA acetyltransferase